MSNSPRMPLSPEAAKQQAAEYFGFAASAFIQVKGGKVFEIPNPGLLDDDQQARWEALQFELEQCDREPGVELPPRTIIGDDGEKIEVPGTSIPGDYKVPYRINGELLSPPYNVRLAIALFGKEGYEEYKAGGGISNQIALEWARMNKEYQERLAEDPKSAGSLSEMEDLPKGD